MGAIGSSKAFRTGAALVALSILGVCSAPGCVIKLGKGSGTDETGSAGGSPGGGGAGGQSSTQDVDPFQNADAAEVNRQGLKASAAAYLLEGTIDQSVELQGIDPESLDAATAQQFIDDTWPSAVAQADAWLSTLDPSVFDAQVKPPTAYCNSLGCPTKVYCESEYYKKTITCYQQACGDAGCKVCPDWFGPLKHLVITAWCSYVCMDGDTVVGSAAVVITRWDPYQRCILP